MLLAFVMTLWLFSPAHNSEQCSGGQLSLGPAEQQFLAMSGVLGGGGAVAQDSLQVVQTILTELEGVESPGEGSEADSGADSGADIPAFPPSPAPPSQLQHGISHSEMSRMRPTKPSDQCYATLFTMSD